MALYHVILSPNAVRNIDQLFQPSEDNTFLNIIHTKWNISFHTPIFISDRWSDYQLIDRLDTYHPDITPTYLVPFQRLFEWMDDTGTLTTEGRYHIMTLLRNQLKQESEGILFLSGTRDWINEYLTTYQPDLRIQQREINDTLSSFPWSCIEPNLSEELYYLETTQSLVEQGISKEDRTGVGTYSKFGVTFSFDLQKGRLPMYTTKRVPFKTIVNELLWFLSGSCDSKELEKKGVNIWKGNTSRAFLDSRGLRTYQEGELGPGYGFQWRRFGCSYRGLIEYNENEGMDQIRYLIDLLLHEPDSRRMVLSAWNPCDINKMALPPCHIMFQLYTSPPTTNVPDQRRTLSSHVYMRSNDAFLGHPFNITSYSVLTHMLAHVTNMKCGKIHLTVGDYHLYKNHSNAFNQQKERYPHPFPRLVIHTPHHLQSFDTVHQKKMSREEQTNNALEQLLSIQIEDMTVLGYRFHPTIRAPMAV